MSNLVGSYVCKELNAEFIIAEANDSNGQGKGTFRLGKISLAVSIHYHFKNSGGPETSLSFVGNIDDPNYYTGGAGSLPNLSSVNGIKIAGGFATISDTISFSGNFIRV